jgi:hypothetical protein
LQIRHRLLHGSRGGAQASLHLARFGLFGVLKLELVGANEDLFLGRKKK